MFTEGMLYSFAFYKNVLFSRAARFHFTILLWCEAQFVA